MVNMIDLASAWKVDLVVRKDRAFSRDELARRMKMSVLGVPVFVASPEDTIVAKLEWSRLAGVPSGNGPEGRAVHEEARDLV